MLIECKYCEAIVDAKILKSYEDYDDRTEVNTKYSFLKCLLCKHPLLVVQEDLTDGDGWSNPVLLYPRKDMPIPGLKYINISIPEPIQTAYEEASACFEARQYNAAAIMCRKTLQGICDEHGASGDKLAWQLKSMREKGIIEKGLFEWANALRELGNDAAHDVNIKISVEDARDIMDFTNALLEYVYTFRDQFERFKKRRSINDT